MKGKFSKALKIPKRVGNWLRIHTIEDLKAAMWEIDGKKSRSCCWNP